MKNPKAALLISIAFLTAALALYMFRPHPPDIVGEWADTPTDHKIPIVIWVFQADGSAAMTIQIPKHFSVGPGTVTVPCSYTVRRDMLTVKATGPATVRGFQPVKDDEIGDTNSPGISGGFPPVQTFLCRVVGDRMTLTGGGVTTVLKRVSLR